MRSNDSYANTYETKVASVNTTPSISNPSDSPGIKSSGPLTTNFAVWRYYNEDLEKYKNNIKRPSLPGRYMAWCSQHS